MINRRAPGLAAPVHRVRRHTPSVSCLLSWERKRFAPQSRPCTMVTIIDWVINQPGGRNEHSGRIVNPRPTAMYLPPTGWECAGDGVGHHRMRSSEFDRSVERCENELIRLTATSFPRLPSNSGWGLTGSGKVWQISITNTLKRD